MVIFFSLIVHETAFALCLFFPICQIIVVMFESCNWCCRVHTSFTALYLGIIYTRKSNLKVLRTCFQ